MHKRQKKNLFLFLFAFWVWTTFCQDLGPVLDLPGNSGWFLSGDPSHDQIWAENKKSKNHNLSPFFSDLLPGSSFGHDIALVSANQSAALIAIGAPNYLNLMGRVWTFWVALETAQIISDPKPIDPTFAGESGISKVPIQFGSSISPVGDVFFDGAADISIEWMTITGKSRRIIANLAQDGRVVQWTATPDDLDSADSQHQKSFLAFQKPGHSSLPVAVLFFGITLTAVFALCGTVLLGALCLESRDRSAQSPRLGTPDEPAPASPSTPPKNNQKTPTSPEKTTPTSTSPKQSHPQQMQARTAHDSVPEGIFFNRETIAQHSRASLATPTKPSTSNTRTSIQPSSPSPHHARHAVPRGTNESLTRGGGNTIVVQDRDVRKEKGVTRSALTMSIDSSKVPINKQLLVIDSNKIVLERKLGEGAFGVVFCGTFEERSVAVKQVKPTALQAKNALKDFLDETAVTGRIPPHPNVVTMIGICLQPLSLVLDYVGGGSLERYLQSSFSDPIIRQKITAQLQGKWMSEIAAGLGHIHANKIVHRDLACRNVLISERHKVAKISDFGMSRLSTGDSNFTANNLGPLKWMAPESLRLNTYSFKSDVWAYGITCAEIFIRGYPYADIPSTRFATQFFTSNLSIMDYLPAKTPQLVRDIIESTQKMAPEQRPTVAEIQQQLLGHPEAFPEHLYVDPTASVSPQVVRKGGRNDNEGGSQKPQAELQRTAREEEYQYGGGSEQSIAYNTTGGNTEPTSEGPNTVGAAEEPESVVYNTTQDNNIGDEKKSGGYVDTQIVQHEHVFSGQFPSRVESPRKE